MIIYKCIISGDEMFSDTFLVKETPDGMFYEVEGKMVTRTQTFDESSIGANASAEEQCEVNEDSSVSGCDIVLNHKLQPTGFDKKSYTAYIKDYVKAVKAKLQEDRPERVEGFMAAAPGAVKKIMGNFKTLEFFTGESMNADGIVGMLDFREDDTPFMLFFKDGLEAEKC